MNTVRFLIQTLINIHWGILIFGYLLYKSKLINIETWEAGVTKVITGGFHFAYEQMTGKQRSEQIVDTALLLTNDEALELVRRLDGHPYDTPTLASYDPNVNGISWYDINAISLISQYKDLSTEQIKRIAFHIIQNFFMETRNIQIFIDIKAATPARLYFAVPLSEEGRKFLEKQQKLHTHVATSDSPPDVMEEEIDIWNDSGAVKQ